MQIRSGYLLLPIVLLMLTACGSPSDDKTPTARPETSAALAAVKARGVQIAGSFDAPGELTGYAGRRNGEPVTVYITPGGDLALVGTLFDSEGVNVGKQALLELVIKPHAKRMWAKLEDSAWVAEGPDEAARTLYAFSDPNCPYCHIFWKRVQPWVDSGQVQVRYVMVGVITQTSANKAAAILTAASPTSALLKNHHKFKAGGITPSATIETDVRAELAANAQLMQNLGLTGTPGIVYRGDNGRLKRWRGVPSKKQLTRVLGPAAG